MIRRTVKEKGRSESASLGMSHGRAIRTRPLGQDEKPKDVAPAASLRASALRRSAEGETPSPRIRAEDIRLRVRRPSVTALILFLLDVSDSMGAHTRIRDAKGSVIGLLKTAHQMRYRVGLITVQGKDAQLTVPPTSSVQRAKKKMSRMSPTGGTPLASGLRLAVKTIRNEELKHPGILPVLLVVSDGEATVPIGRYGDPHLELMEIAERIQHRENIVSICVDTKERSPHAVGRSEMESLSEALGADYYHRDQLGSSRSGAPSAGQETSTRS